MNKFEAFGRAFSKVGKDLKIEAEKDGINFNMCITDKETIENIKKLFEVVK